MPGKHVTLLVYRSDRNVWSDGRLTCRVIDLFANGGPRVLISRSIPPAIELDFDVPFDGPHAYGISVDAGRHRSGWHVLTRRSFLRDDGAGPREVDHTIVRTMLVHRKAQPSNLVAAFKQLESHGSPFALFGAQRFHALRQTAARLAFLNLEAKLRETRIGLRPLLSFVRDIREAHVDRVFLFVAAELRALIEQSSEFSDAPGHGAPAVFPTLPAHPDSWKHTKFAFGNLQLSFSRAAIPHRGISSLPEPCYSVDCDIDLERDLGHAFEFIHNHVFGKTTDQTLVYRMLWDQGILPAYHLAPAAAVAPAARVHIAMESSAAEGERTGEATGARSRRPKSRRRARGAKRSRTTARRTAPRSSSSARVRARRAAGAKVGRRADRSRRSG